MRAGHLRNVSQPLRASVFLLGKSGKVVLTIQGDECMSSTQHPARLLVDVQYMVASENSFFAAHKQRARPNAVKIFHQLHESTLYQQAFIVLCQEYLQNTYHMLPTLSRAGDPQVRKTRDLPYKNMNHFHLILKKGLKRRECTR